MISIFRFMFLFILSFSLSNPVALAQDNLRQTPVVQVVQDNASAVVNISTERVVLLRESPYWGSYGSEFDIFFDRFFGSYAPTRALKLKSVGSGVVVGQDGIIVTNFHVVSKATNIIVVFNDGSSTPGELMYENPLDDIAVIKINPPKTLKQVKLGKTDDLMMGETVIAIGNPLGLENSVTSGVISGKNRNLYGNGQEIIMKGLIQIDAPINPGNSGGALFNIIGELIGINVAVVENSQSIGFAIPVEKVREALRSYEENKDNPIKKPIPRPTLRPRMNQNFSKDDDFDPYSEMAKMREQMDEMFQNYIGRMNHDPGTTSIIQSNNFFDPNINMEEKEDQYVVTLDIAELDKNNVNVDIKESSITISGQYSREVKEDSQQGQIHSHSYGSMLKTIALPKDADASKIKTDIKDNKLTITIPKKKNRN